MSFRPDAVVQKRKLCSSISGEQFLRFFRWLLVLSACGLTCTGLLAQTGSSAPVVVQFAQNGENNTASQAASFANPITAGNSIVCGVMFASTSLTPTISDTLGSTWTSLGTATQGANLTVQAWLATPFPGGNEQVTVSLGGTAYQNTQCVEIWGSSGLDVTARGSGSGTANVTTAATTTTAADDLALLFVGLNKSGAGQTFAPGAGWSNIINSGSFAFSAAESVPFSGTAVSGAGTLGGTNNGYAALLVTLKSSNSSNPPTTPLVQFTTQALSGYYVSHPPSGGNTCSPAPCAALPYPDPNQAGDALFVWVEWAAGGSTLSALTDTCGNTYMHVPGYPVNFNSFAYVDDFWIAFNSKTCTGNKVIASFGPGTVTGAWMLLAEYSGATGLDASNSVHKYMGSSAPLTMTGAAVTTTSPNDLIVTVTDMISAGPAMAWQTVGAGLTGDANCLSCAVFNGGYLGGSVLLEHQYAPSTGTYTATATDKQLNNPTVSIFSFALRTQ